MAPDKKGRCSVCQTLWFECECADFRATRQLKRQLSNGAFDDVVNLAQAEDSHYGVMWCQFMYDGYSDNSSLPLIRNMVHELVDAEKPHEMYIGLCKNPSWRFYEKPSPHCMRWTKMWVLCVGHSMNLLEKQLISYFKEYLLHKRGGQPCRLTNDGPGGEGISPHSVRFLYVCFKMPPPKQDKRKWVSSDSEDESLPRDGCDGGGAASSAPAIPPALAAPAAGGSREPTVMHAAPVVVASPRSKAEEPPRKKSRVERPLDEQFGVAVRVHNHGSDLQTCLWEHYVVQHLPRCDASGFRVV